MHVEATVFLCSKKLSCLNAFEHHTESLQDPQVSFTFILQNVPWESNCNSKKHPPSDSFSLTSLWGVQTFPKPSLFSVNVSWWCFQLTQRTRLNLLRLMPCFHRVSATRFSWCNKLCSDEFPLFPHGRLLGTDARTCWSQLMMFTVCKSFFCNRTLV